MGDACKRCIPLVPPFHKAPAEFSPAEARAYFDWYLSHLDGRCEYLKELVYQTSDLAEGTLDYTLESLRPLWAWFLPRAGSSGAGKRGCSGTCCARAHWNRNLPATSSSRDVARSAQKPNI